MTADPFELDIRLANHDDIDRLVDLASAEGWRPGTRDGDLVRSLGARALVAQTRSETIGGILAVPWNKHCSFIGYYLVVPQWRGLGIGRRLWDATLELIGESDAELNAVPRQVSNYEMSEFKCGVVVLTIVGSPSVTTSPFRTPNDDVEFIEFNSSVLSDLAAWDEVVGGEARGQYLSAWFSHPDMCTEIARRLSDGQVIGVLSARPSDGDLWRIGPWYSSEIEVADLLWNRMMAKIGPNVTVMVHVPETSHRAVALLRSYSLTVKDITVRMRRGSAPKPLSASVFAIVSPEFG